MVEIANDDLRLLQHAKEIADSFFLSIVPDFEEGKITELEFREFCATHAAFFRAGDVRAFREEMATIEGRIANRTEDDDAAEDALQAYLEAEENKK